MLLSLVDSLRCPADHEASSLVLSADQWTDGRVSSGFLGCPVCHARYAIHNGVVDFTLGADSVDRAPSTGVVAATNGLRLAAQLDLGDGGGLVLLTGAYATQAASLREMVDAAYLLVDADVSTADASLAVGFRLLERIPLVDGALRAAAVDASRSSPFFLADVARCVRHGGRIVAPIESLPPISVRVIARDEREWVGEVERFSSLVTPQRALRR